MKTYDPSTHTYRSDGIVRRGVTSIIKGAGLMEHWSDDPYYLDRGSAIHTVTELWDRGTLDQFDCSVEALGFDVVPWLDGWKLFMLETGAVWDSDGIEKRVDCEALRYAGRVDRIGTVNGVRSTVDIKSGTPANWTSLQLAAYVHANGVLMRRLAVHLPGNGKYSLKLPYEITEQAHDFAVFRACLTVINWKENN